MGLRVTNIASGYVRNGKFSRDAKVKNPLTTKFVDAKARMLPNGDVELMIQNPHKAKTAKKSAKKRAAKKATKRPAKKTARKTAKKTKR